MGNDLERVRDAMLRRVDRGPAVAAYSGGVDSTLVAVIASDLFGAAFTAVTVDTAFVPRRELVEAAEVARALRIPHEVLSVDVFKAGIAGGTSADRCYRCKKLLLAHMSERFPGVLLDGTNAGDDPTRPGMRALREAGAFSPLAAAGLDKARVRALARKLGLPNADKPSNSCLATRIGSVALSRSVLERVESLEVFLHERGLTDVRARTDDMKVIVEVSRGARQILERDHERIRSRVEALGWKLAGYGLRPGE